jgi:CRP-like cAMP-binding protein
MGALKSLLKTWRRTPESPYDAVLQQYSLFQTLTRRERDLVGLILHERTYVAGEFIFEQGEEGMGMYIILEGKVRIVYTSPTIARELAVISTGESFGQITLLEGVIRSASAIAIESPTRLPSLFRPDLFHLIETHNEIGYKITYELACIIARQFRTRVSKEPGN